MVLLTALNSAKAQQQLVFTDYMMNSHYFNPAIAGSKTVHEANITSRNQWAGFEGAPSTLLGSYHGSLKNNGKVGYGIMLVSERVSLIQNTGFYLNYAQHFKLNDKVKLGFGIQPGFIQYRIKLYDAQLADEGDDVLTGNILSSNGIDFNGGFHLYSDQFFLMGSVKSLLGESIEFTSLNSSLNKHYTLIAGYNFKLKNKPWVIQPSFLAKGTDPVPSQFSLMAKMTYDDKFWGALLYRTENAAGVSIGIKLKKRISIGYAYDYSLWGIRNYNNGSHEIVLSFVTTPPKKLTLEEEDDKLNKSIMDDLRKQLEENKRSKNN